MTADILIIIYDLILFAAFAAAVWIVIVTWRWRRAPGSKSLMIQMIGEGWWTLCYALHLSTCIRPEPYFWSKLMFLGVVMVPAGFLVWASRYTNRDGWVNNRSIRLLLIEPILFNIIIWTDPWHGLFSGSYITTGTLGIAFWLHSAYSYILLTIGGLMLFLNWLQVTYAYRKQAFLVLLGLPIAWLANIVTIFQLTPLKDIDFSPLGFFAAGAIFTYAQLRHHLFDLLPVAHHTVLENMLDGVMVLDTEDRIIDLNKSAQEILGINLNEALGKAAGSALPAWQEAEVQSTQKQDVHVEFLMKGTEKRNIDLSTTALYDHRNQPYGKLVMLRDITNIKHIENALRETNENLSQKLAEIEALQIKLKEEAIRDPLTGLYNRRFLQETLNREIAHADRASIPLSLAMIDLDHFKKINDTYGHLIGDLFLITLGNLLAQKTRSSDVSCRYGGEEFVIVMPAATLEEAAQRTDQLRVEFSEMKIDTGNGKIGITLSAGVAGYPIHGNSDKNLLDAADRALYAAKAKGRNRVLVAE
ncbi:MAG: diguanylate cyclase [Smithellaceae bacterium]|jgi:diguanylate cyclase (GGDEF)-like protein/PAS domain S-box-containing protein